MEEQDTLVYLSKDFHIINPEGESRQRELTFNFDPRQYEMVRGKDGAYIIRKRKATTLSVV